MLSVNYYEQKKKMDKELMQRIKHRKKLFTGAVLRQFDSLRRDLDEMSFAQLCKDEKAFYLYKRAGTS